MVDFRNPRDISIRTILGEAGGESYTGQVAVMSVIQNRADYTGKSLTDVIMQPGQFSMWNSVTGYAGGAQGQDPSRWVPGSPEYERAGKIYDDVTSGRVADPTGGALNYYNPSVSQPRWGQGSPTWEQGPTIGNHTFGTDTSTWRNFIPENSWSPEFTRDLTRGVGVPIDELAYGGQMSGIGAIPASGPISSPVENAALTGPPNESGAYGYGGYWDQNQRFEGSQVGMEQGTPNQFNSFNDFRGERITSPSEPAAGWQEAPGAYDPATGQWQTPTDPRDGSPAADGTGADGSGVAPAEAPAEAPAAGGEAAAPQSAGEAAEAAPNAAQPGPMGQAGSIPQAIVTGDNQVATATANAGKAAAQAISQSAKATSQVNQGIVSSFLTSLYNVFERSILFIIGALFIAFALFMLAARSKTVQDATKAAVGVAAKTPIK